MFEWVDSILTRGRGLIDFEIFGWDEGNFS